MTVKSVLSPRDISDESRAAKNAAIKKSMQETRARRASQVARVVDLKVVSNRLNRAQREALAMIFVEAKWLRNAVVASEDAFEYKIGATVPVKTKDGQIEEREFRHLGSQMKQSVHSQVLSDIKGLSALKKNGHKVGSLGFTGRVSSIDLKQYGGTHRITSNRIKVQNIPGRLTVRGTHQIGDAEPANAKIVRRADGYHVLLTIFIDRSSERADVPFTPGTEIGLDMGMKTAITLSDGTAIHAVFGESDRLKRLRRKKSRQVKGSNGYWRTRALIARESQKITRRKDDAANKVVRALLAHEVVYLQDEMISSWKTRSGFFSGGKRVQESILGRVKSKLVSHPRAVVLPRYVATTATCVCGVKTKHAPDRREFACPSCGYRADRDVHAAQNMIRLGKLLNTSGTEGINARGDGRKTVRAHA